MQPKQQPRSLLDFRSAERNQTCLSGVDVAKDLEDQDERHDAERYRQADDAASGRIPSMCPVGLEQLILCAPGILRRLQETASDSERVDREKQGGNRQSEKC